MVLRMNHPWPHPKSGIYYFRKRVPERLKALVGKAEEKISLRTRNAEEAKIEFARVSLEVDKRWRTLSSGIQSLTEKQAIGIAGEIYRSMVEQHEDNPSRVPIVDLLFDDAVLRPGSVKIFPMGTRPDLTRVALERAFERRIENNTRKVDEWLKDRGLLLDADSRKRVDAAVERAIRDARRYIRQMASGDYSPDPAASRFPKLELQAPQQQAAPEPKGRVTFTDIINLRAQKRAAGKDGRPLSPSSIKKYELVAREFAEFRDSEDATTTTIDEAEAWCDAMLEDAALSNRSITDRMINLGTIINWGQKMRQSRKSMASAEVLSGRIELPTYVEKSADVISYTLEEARHVLQKARSETDPRTRWLPWLLCYGGLRISEANALRKEDFYRCEGHWFFKVTSRGGRSLKTARSERKIPVHPALEAEGFLKWVQTAASGRLFAPGATSFMGRWVRGDAVGITRTELAPNHGLRHLFIGLCRRNGVQDEPREYLSGHASAKVHAKYGSSDVMLPGLAAEMDKIAPLLPVPERRAA